MSEQLYRATMDLMFMQKSKENFLTNDCSDKMVLPANTFHANGKKYSHYYDEYVVMFTMLSL